MDSRLRGKDDEVGTTSSPRHNVIPHHNVIHHHNVIPDSIRDPSTAYFASPRGQPVYLAIFSPLH